MDLRMLVPIFGIILVMIPVAGVTLAFTLRFAVRPFVETLAKAMRDIGDPGGTGRAELETLALTVEELRREVARLREAQSFDRDLLEPTSVTDRGRDTL